MKILIVTSLYPPQYVGGYELRCAQAAEALLRAGHDVRVLTSRYSLSVAGSFGIPASKETIHGVSVERSLHFRPWETPPRFFYTLELAKRQIADARCFLKIFTEFGPDIVNWWNLEGLTKTILPIPAAAGVPDVHWVEDSTIVSQYGAHGETEPTFWFPFWQGNWGPSPVRPLLRRVLRAREKELRAEGIPTRPFPYLPRHVCFVSEFLRFDFAQAGLVFPSSEVIYGGVVPDRFHAVRTRADFEAEPLRLLYGGYISPDRGLHAVIEALGLLPREIRGRLHLSIAHSGPPKPSEYVKAIHSRIAELDLSGTVSFIGRMQHEEMARVYREHHVLVFPSTRKEGLPMTMMESMCSGCAVITTGSGGAIELADQAGLPLFPKDHPVALSRLLAKLATNREFVYRVAMQGQETVMAKFTFERMMEDFSRMLYRLADAKAKGELAPSANRTRSDRGAAALRQPAG
jgi:glycogen(starch) synthase